jgi:hypothetical protein
MVVSLTVNLFAYFINRQKAANLYRKVAKKEHHCRFAVLPFCRFAVLPFCRFAVLPLFICYKLLFS